MIAAGFFAVTALAGFGAMMAAAAGELAADWITGDDRSPNPLKATFEPRRFDDRNYLAIERTSGEL